MLNTPEQEQKEHDEVLTIVTERLKETRKYKIYTNPGQEHKVVVGGVYPDIILTDTNSNIVRVIIEAETTSSVQKLEVSQRQKLSLRSRTKIYYCLLTRG
jgi:hypothetical protein